MATSNALTVSTKLQRIAELAKEDSQRILTSLAYFIDRDFLQEAYRRTRKSAAPGIDGQTATEYGRHLEENLSALLDRFKSGTYRAPPVKRAYIPKDGGGKRPLGLPTLEDKILQRAVTMVLTAVYEQDFLDCSFGCRPGRSAHQAVGTLREKLREMQGGWVLDLDIQGFFDHLDHKRLREILDQRVRDGVLRRTIHKWLKAGILEDGELRQPREGTPQGGVISPLLANIYLHTVVDQWFHRALLPRLRGRAFLVRYVDDVVMVFANQQDAERVFQVLPKRLARFGLTLHPEKTRLLRFRPGPRKSPPSKEPPPTSGTFDFLGFTHYWARSRRRQWVIKRKTAKSRFHRALSRITDWCRVHRHLPIVVQHHFLTQKLRGHYHYYGITGNSPALSKLKWHTERIWKRWLERRSQKGRLRWDVFQELLQRWPLPPPSVRAVA